MLLLTACVWIDDEHAAWRLDPDGDRVTWDEDCDNTDPDVGAAITVYSDLDGDGHGGTAVTGCDVSGVTTSDDCDDADPDRWPGNPERCDGVDQDCDDTIDDGLEPTLDWYVDADGDGSGAGEVAGTACAAPEGGSLDGDDCDDTDATVFPDADEVTCDGLDQDCDGADVGTAAPGEYATIQAAIDGAPDDAWLCVEEGTWYESLVIDRPVTLEGPGATFDGANADHVVEATADVTLIGLTIQGGYGDQGAGLRGTARMVLDGVTVQHNRCDAETCFGTGILVDGGDLVATDLDVSENEQSASSPQGAGVMCVSGSLELRDAWIHDNTQAFSATGAGAGLYAVTCDTVLETVEISDNIQIGDSGISDFAYGRGAAMMFSTGDLTMHGVDVHDNRTEVGGAGSSGTAYGVIELAIATVSLTEVSLTANTCACADLSCFGEGAALYVTDSVLDGTDLTIAANVSRLETDSGYTRGVGARFGQSTVNLDGVEFTGNRLETGELASYAAGFYVASGTVTVDHLRMVDNGGVANPTYSVGVAIQTEGDLTITNGQILGNGLDGGGGGYLINPLGGSLTLTNVDLVGNTVSNGGTLRLGAADVTLRSVSFVGNRNSTGSAGGALTRNGTTGATDIAWSNFYDNGESPFLKVDDPTGADGNIAVDPLYIDVSGDADAWDLHLGEGSLCIDAGDPAVLDEDGSRADVGGFGGPSGAW